MHRATNCRELAEMLLQTPEATPLINHDGRMVPVETVTVVERSGGGVLLLPSRDDVEPFATADGK